MSINQPNSLPPLEFITCNVNNGTPKAYLPSNTKVGTIIKGTDGKCYTAFQKWATNPSAAPVIVKSGSTTPVSCNDCGGPVYIYAKTNVYSSGCVNADTTTLLYRINGGPWISSQFTIDANQWGNFYFYAAIVPSAAFGSTIDVYFPNILWGIGENSGDFTSRCNNQYYSFIHTLGTPIFLNLSVDVGDFCTFIDCIPPYPRPRPWDWEVYDYNNDTYVNLWGEDYGTYGGRNFYNIPMPDYSSTESVVWYDSPNDLWTQSSTLAGGTVYSTLSSVDPVYPVSSLANPWTPINTSSRSIVRSEPVYPITTDGLVLWYDAGSTLSWPSSSTSLFDITNNNNDGTFYTSINPTIPTYLTPNMGGFSFNGSNQKIICGNGTSLSSISNTVSVEAWVKPDLFKNFSEIFSKNSNQGFRMRLTSLGQLSMIGGRNGGVDEYVSTGTTTVNQWVHLVGVWTPTGYYTYINGVSAGYDNTKTLLVQANNNVLEIGVRTGGNDWFDGTISIFRVYNRALSSTDVLNNFNCEKNRFFNITSNI